MLTKEVLWVADKQNGKWRIAGILTGKTEKKVIWGNKENCMEKKYSFLKNTPDILYEECVNNRFPWDGDFMLKWKSFVFSMVELPE